MPNHISLKGDKTQMTQGEEFYFEKHRKQVFDTTIQHICPFTSACVKTTEGTDKNLAECYCEDLSNFSLINFS